MQEAAEPFATVGDLTFEREEALIIDWKHQDKDAVICGSEAVFAWTFTEITACIGVER